MDSSIPIHTSTKSSSSHHEHRPVYSTPSHRGSAQVNKYATRIKFRHPGYPEGQNLLMILDAFDGTGSNGSGGLHYATARLFCGILANCAWESFLSETRDGCAIDLPNDGVLTKSVYYFHVENEPRYAVVPSFAHFRFPHQNTFPQYWAETFRLPTIEADATGSTTQLLRNMPDFRHGIVNRDETCRLTCSRLAVEAAHLVPLAEVEWFRANEMEQYASAHVSGTGPMDVSNALLLRRDLHWLFDRRNFVFVPKRGRWVCHVMDQLGEGELVDCYHNVPLLPLRGIGNEFLLARVAWTVLARNVFLNTVFQPRSLVLVREDGQVETRDVSPKECRQIRDIGLRGTAGGKSRSASPSKRKADEIADDVDGASSLWDGCTDMDDCHDGYGSMGEERGRKRFRFSPPTHLSTVCS